MEYREFAKIIADDHWNCLDDLDKASLVAFTWTPDPNKYPSYDPRHQYKVLLQHILLSSYKFFRKFMFIPELNANGNIHIHGWYIIKDKIKYFRTFLPQCKKLGFVLCKTTYKDKPIDINWHNYCTEDLEDTVGVLDDDLPIPLIDDNIKCYIQVKRTKRTYTSLRLKQRMEETKYQSVTDYFK